MQFQSFQEKICRLHNHIEFGGCEISFYLRLRVQLAGGKRAGPKGLGEALERPQIDLVNRDLEHSKRVRQIQAPRQPKRAIAEPRLHLKRKRRDPPVICKILKADLNTFKRQRYRRGRSSVPKIEVAVYEIEGTNRKVKGSAFIICGNRTFAAFSPLGQSQGCQWREVSAEPRS